MSIRGTRELDKWTITEQPKTAILASLISHLQPKAVLFGESAVHCTLCNAILFNHSNKSEKVNQSMDKNILLQYFLYFFIFLLIFIVHLNKFLLYIFYNSPSMNTQNIIKDNKFSFSNFLSFIYMTF